MSRQLLETEQKALEINLDNKIYGSFAEIGAGQEVARHFFHVGAAAGTIAKTMSAYDKVVSDKIYGVEASGRYVCESRLYKMLDHEFDLMETRLSDERPDTAFFAFADTVAAVNYHRTIKGDGWLGIRFQLQPGKEPNNIVLHVKMLDIDNSLQQHAIGILGVNLIYGCYRYNDNLEYFIESLLDNLHGRVQVDMLRISGPDYLDVDNRKVSLLLVEKGLTDVTMFDETGTPVHASEFLYKKYALVVRGSFRPATLVNMDMLRSAGRQFKAEEDVDTRKTKVLAEITLDNLRKDGPIDHQDFLDRAELLGELGQIVVVSNCEEHNLLIKYLQDFKIKKLGLVIGARQLLDVMNDKYDTYKGGKLLASLGELFTKDVKMYVYPAMQEGSAELMTTENLPLPEGFIHLYKHLISNDQIVDLEEFNSENLHIYSKRVLQMLRSDEEGWEKQVPSKVAKLIKEKCLFGYPCQRLEFEY